jgi:hypothetical protein
MTANGLSANRGLFERRLSRSQALDKVDRLILAGSTGINIGSEWRGRMSPYRPSRRQIEANRRNAQLSTGPRTADGKLNSRRNALTHGLTASDVIIDGEDPEAFEALRDVLTRRFKPRDALEEELIGRAASLLWRLRRIPAFEAAVLEHLREEEAVQFGDDLDFTSQSKRSKGQRDLARAIKTFLSRDLTTKLSSYEVRLQRQLESTFRQLGDLQAGCYEEALVIDHSAGADAGQGQARAAGLDDDGVEHNDDRLPATSGS